MVFSCQPFATVGASSSTSSPSISAPSATSAACQYGDRIKLCISTKLSRRGKKERATYLVRGFRVNLFLSKFGYCVFPFGPMHVVSTISGPDGLIVTASALFCIIYITWYLFGHRRVYTESWRSATDPAHAWSCEPALIHISEFGMSLSHSERGGAVRIVGDK